MKILKSFIILFGLITLALTNMNAQKATVELVLHEDGWYAADPLIPEGPGDPPTEYMRPGNNIIVKSIVPRKLVLVIYTHEDGQELDTRISDDITTIYRPQVEIMTAWDPDKELYFECGFMDSNGAYQKDGGCTVIIHPDNSITVGDGN